MNNDNIEAEIKQFIEARTRRALGIKALRHIRAIVDDMEREDATDRKTVKIIGLVLAVLMLALATTYIFNKDNTLQAPALETTKVIPAP